MIRRFAVVVLACVAIGTVTACSAAQRQGSWCALHAALAVKDIRHHSHGWAALQAGLATYHCTKALAALGNRGG